MAAKAMMTIAVVVMQDGDTGGEGQIGAAWTAVLGVMERRTKQRPMDDGAQEYRPCDRYRVQIVGRACRRDAVGYNGDEGKNEEEGIRNAGWRHEREKVGAVLAAAVEGLS